MVYVGERYSSNEYQNKVQGLVRKGLEKRRLNMPELNEIGCTIYETILKNPDYDIYSFGFPKIEIGPEEEPEIKKHKENRRRAIGRLTHPGHWVANGREHSYFSLVEYFTSNLQIALGLEEIVRL